MLKEDVNRLKKIQDGIWDDDIESFVIESLKWYKEHSKDLLEE